MIKLIRPTKIERAWFASVNDQRKRFGNHPLDH
jgi:hypothetical protein